MEYLSRMFEWLGTEPKALDNQKTFWSCVDHYPLFLDGNMRNLLRDSLYKAVDHTGQPTYECDHIFFLKYPNYNWMRRVQEQDFRMVLDKGGYCNKPYSFIKFCRHNIMHLEEHRMGNRTANNVDHVLSNLWPGYLTALFNHMVLGQKALLVSHGSLH